MTPIDLHPTPTRLALLDLIDREHVYDSAWHPGCIVRDLDGPRKVQKLTARVTEAMRAGWVERPAGTRLYRLTATGRALLTERTPA